MQASQREVLENLWLGSGGDLTRSIKRVLMVRTPCLCELMMESEMDQKHYAIVTQGRDAVMRWRRDHPAGRLLLSGADFNVANLTGIDFTGADLRNADLTGADLSGANLNNADLSGSRLRDANLSGANLTGCDLSSADLSGANLHATVLTDVDLSGVDLGTVEIGNAVFGTPAEAQHAASLRRKARKRVSEVSNEASELTDSSSDTPFLPPLVVYVDPGAAEAETIRDLFLTLSALYEAQGGSGLQIVKHETGMLVGEEVPV